MALERRMTEALSYRRQQGRLRFVHDKRVAVGEVDFCSNDYLGLARSQALQTLVAERREEHRPDYNVNGSTGSRLISGNSELATHLEQELAAFYSSASALLFSSGFMANVGLLSSLPKKRDVVLMDARVHNSTHAGLRLSRVDASDVHSFRHNSVSDVSALLEKHATLEATDDKCVFVVVESLYSMDGDFCPLRQLLDLCLLYANVYVVLDEAHSSGIVGSWGGGLFPSVLSSFPSRERKTVGSRVFRMHSFGKGLGGHGAVVCGPELLTSFLINYARSFVYSTAMASDQLLAIGAAHEVCASMTDERRRLQELVAYCVSRATRLDVVSSLEFHQTRVGRRKETWHSPIVSIQADGEDHMQRVLRQLRRRKIKAVPIRPPTVPEGEERVRVVLHAFNRREDIDVLLDALASVSKTNGNRAKL